MSDNKSLDGRLKLHAWLLEVLGTNNVYFQPPESMKLLYPCIIYRRNRNEMHHADNKPYKKNMQYEIILVDKDPDSVYLDKLTNLPGIRFDRHYASDNLNHDVFTIFI